MKKKVLGLSVGLMVGMTAFLSAKCPQHIKNEFIAVASVIPFNINKLQHLHDACQNNKEIEMMLFLAKADASEEREETEKAYSQYKKVQETMGKLSTQVRNSFTNLSNIESYLEKQIERYKPLTSDEITRSIYRGADMREEYKVDNLPVNFKTGSSRIEKRVNLIQAQNIAKALNIPKYKNKIIYITGYTDTRDSETKNLKLGQSRATSLKRYLKNVAKLSNIIVSDSKGEGFPIFKANGKEDLYKSRRVAIAIGEKSR